MQEIKIMHAGEPERVPNHFHPGMEQNFAMLQFHIKAIIEYLEAREPGASEELSQRVFYHKCYAVMFSRETAMKKATPENALQTSAIHNNMVGKLEKEAHEKSWLDVFNRALKNAKHAGKEA